MDDSTKLQLEQKILEGLDNYFYVAENNGLGEVEAISIYLSTVSAIIAKVLGTNTTKQIFQVIHSSLDIPDWAKDLKRDISN